MYSRKRIETIRAGICRRIAAQIRLQNEERLRLPPTYQSMDCNIKSLADSLGLVPLTNVYSVSPAVDGETPNFYDVASKLFLAAYLAHHSVPEAIGWFKGGYDDGFYAQGFGAKL